MLWTTTMLILSVGEYRQAKRSGYAKWARMSAHVSPVNPATGQPVVGIEQVVEFYPADQAVAGLLAQAQASAENISIAGKNYQRYKFVGDAVPVDYKDMFSFMGDLVWEYIDFGQEMVTVRKSDDDRKIEVVRDEHNKPIIKTGKTLAYWVGPMVTSGLQLSREYRLSRMMRDWIPVNTAFVNSDASDAKEEQGENKDMPGEA